MADLPPERDQTAVTAVAALADRLREELYHFVRRAAQPVTRDEAAAAAGISRRLAAFHLDKLVAVGLLRARYDRTDRMPGVGRSPKVYEPSDAEVQVQVPERHYELAAEILLDALAEDGDEAEQLAFHRALDVARRRGRSLGQANRPSAPGARIGPERGLSAAEGALNRCGYEPSRIERDRLQLANCPFHRLADRHRDLVCGLNHAFCAGIVDGIGASGVRAVLAPSPSHCCVEVRTDSGDGIAGAKQSAAELSSPTAE